MKLYTLLEKPIVYQIVQIVLAPGMHGIVKRQLTKMTAEIPHKALVLDVACGPSSRLWRIGMRPIGLDLSHTYALKFRESGGVSVTASARELPFRSDTFDAVLCFGLLHHLPEDVARTAVSEIVRVTRPGGHVIVFDPVLPKVSWRRPVAWTLCKLDRGRFIRRQPEYQSRILSPDPWKVERMMHSYLGTEGVFCLLKKRSKIVHASEVTGQPHRS